MSDFRKTCPECDSLIQRFEDGSVMCTNGKCRYMAPAPVQKQTSDLEDFLKQYREDDNEWWRLSEGEMQRLFDEAVEELTAAQKEIETLKKQLSLTEQDAKALLDDNIHRQALELDAVGTIKTLRSRNDLAVKCIEMQANHIHKLGLENEKLKKQVKQLQDDIDDQHEYCNEKCMRG